MAISNIRLKFSNDKITLKAGDFFVYKISKQSFIGVFKDYVYNECIRYYALNSDGIPSSKIRKIGLNKLSKISVYSEANELKREVEAIPSEEENNLLPEKYMCPNCDRPHYDLQHKKYYKILNNKKGRTKTTCQNILCRAEFFLTIKNNKFEIKYSSL